jgi:hypothetical protein
MLEKIKLWWKKNFQVCIPHLCTPTLYPETGETMIFHWDVPWSFSQTFTVCSECDKVKVLTDTTADNRSPLGGYRKETDGEKWSGRCDYAKVPSIGRDKLTVFKK